MTRYAGITMWAGLARPRARTRIAALAASVACAGALVLAPSSRADGDVAQELHAALAEAAHVPSVASAPKPAPVAPPPARAREVPLRWTPVSELELARVLRDAHHKTFGTEPGGRRLGSAWAHVALENGRGRYIACHNVGNLTIRPHAQVDYFVRHLHERDTHAPLSVWHPVDARFRAYDSAVDGAAGYWQQLALHYWRALALFDAGLAGEGAQNLAENGYASALPMPYAAAVENLYLEYQVRIGPRLAQFSRE